MTRRHGWRHLFRPRVALPLLLTAALLVVALSLGNPGQVMARVKAMPLVNLGGVLAFALCYLVLKAWQLHLLLRGLDLHPGWRRFALAYAVGELALTLPLGVFAQNWVLAGSGRMRFGNTSAATVFMLVMEAVVVLAWLGLNGVPGWPPLQPLALVLLAGMIVMAWACLRFHLPRRLARRVRRRPRMHRALAELAGMLRGLDRLVTWRMSGINLLVTVAYLGALGAAFLVMGHGMGLHGLGYREASTIYAFGLIVVLLAGGIFGQIGTMEVVGMTAARAWGLGFADGLVLMLGFRMAWTGAMWLLNGIVVAGLWRSVRLAPG